MNNIPCISIYNNNLRILKCLHVELLINITVSNLHFFFINGLVVRLDVYGLICTFKVLLLPCMIYNP